MTDQISPKQFRESEGVEDWRVLGDGANAYFQTGSFAAAARLVQAISELPGVDDIRPDIDVRQDGVTVRMVAFIEGYGGMLRAHVDLARQISAAARKLGFSADPSAVQSVLVIPGAPSRAAVMPFWQAVLGYKQVGDEDLLDPRDEGPPIWFQEMEAERPQRNRIHVDVFVPHDQAEERVAAALAAGGRLVSDEHAPAWWTLADAEGNEADVATWLGRF